MLPFSALVHCVHLCLCLTLTFFVHKTVISLSYVNLIVFKLVCILKKMHHKDLKK